MLKLNQDELVFSFPDVHPDAKLTVSFMRTLRIPDDNKTYPLPPGLGKFPIEHVEKFKDRVPHEWNSRGGVMLPIFQSEAAWLNFSCSSISDQGKYPFAIKVATGKRSAITGKEWSNDLREKDYCVAPDQKWLDGYVIHDDVIRQFVAASLGAGFTAEEQITGKAEFGGLQIEVVPMKREVFDRRFPKKSMEVMRGMAWGGDPRGAMRGTKSLRGSASASMGLASMGLAPGGKMQQKVLKDPYDFSDWNTSQHGRCFVHLANSLAWRAITGAEPPTAPRTAAEYSQYSLPWFDLYKDGEGLQGTETLQNLKSVLEFGFQKGFSILPENESVDFKSDQVVQLGEQRPQNQVRDGGW